MATKETKTKADAKFNPAKCDKVAGEISALITGKIAVSRPASIAEGVLIMTLAMGRVLHVLAAVMGINPKTLVKDYCESLTRYIEMGGDSRVEDLAAALRVKGTKTNTSMYHEGTFFRKAYYDTLEEMPNVAKVYFPDEKEPKEMTAAEICKLDDEGWYTIMHSVNWGSCDHWTSEKPSKWVRECFDKIWHYTKNGKADGEHVGYNRASWSIRLTREANYWKSEVWNS